MKNSLKAFGNSVGSLREKLELLKSERDWIPSKELGTIRAYNSEIKNLTKEITRLETINGSKLKTWSKDFANNLPGANLIKNPIAISGAVITGAWAATQKAMQAGKEKMQLQVMAGDKSGTKLYNDLTKFATDTVFGSEVYDMGAQMMANGIKDSDVMPVMKQLGDISMGDSNKLGQLSLAFAQISGKGHLAGQELLQLINAGFNPLQVLADKTGVSYQELTKKMEQGKITVDDVKHAMEIATGPGGRFNDMLNKIADTPYGQLEQLKGQFDQMAITLGQVFLPIASSIMQFFSWLGEKLGPLLQPVGGILATLAAGILIAAAAQWVLNLAVWDFPGTWIVAAIALIIGVVAQAVKYYNTWGKGILLLMGPFGLLISAIKQLYSHWNDIKEAFKTDGIIAGIKKLGEVLLNAVLEPIKGVLHWLSKIPGFLGKAAQAGVDGIDNIQDKLGMGPRTNAASVADMSKLQGVNIPLLGSTYDFVQKGSRKLPTISEGIAPPKLPGKKNKTDNKNGNDYQTSLDTSKTNEAIATGGTKNTTIYITIDKQIEKLEVISNNIREGAGKIRDIIVDEMTRAVAMSQAVAQ
ncbi:MAG: tape measure protein [Bacteroidetes bacterium]|nr:tape measure protein [Bacteroidota bacterium]